MEEWRLKATKIGMKKCIEKEKILLLDIGGKVILEILTSEESKCCKYIESETER